MRAAPENYKGIAYIQISSLPAEQRKSIYQSINSRSIIHILKDDALLSDCLQYQHYVLWFETIFKPAVQEKQIELPASPKLLSLAFK